MTCREVSESLIACRTGAELPPAVRQHAESCANCRALVAACAGGRDVYAVDGALLDRIRGSLTASLAPVRPLPPRMVFVAAFLSILAAAAVSFAVKLGIYGLPRLTAAQAAAIFTALAAFGSASAYAAAGGMRPGLRTLPASKLTLFGIIAIEAVFVAVFRDYDTARFVHAGLICLTAGLACAIPAGLCIGLILRRGYLVSPASTGAAAGAIAGLAGLAMLELHCPLLTVPHVAVWHVAVPLAAIAAGAVLGHLSARRR